VVTVVRLGFYFVCGGGSLCWSVRFCLLLGGGWEGIVRTVGLYEGVKNCIITL